MPQRRHRPRALPPRRRAALRCDPGTALRSPHGASAEELAAAIADGKARPDLDPELVDDDGFPVMSARSNDAVDEALQEEIGEWLTEQGMAQLRWSEAQWRALTRARPSRATSQARL
ncbi:hypothetical protein [Massilia sp. Se16.2.3]|nr:hypothetical protein [Massilia sp. Se16.2.3]QNA98188.1 hypothetical protein G4G31_04010 [Massilia sp. Se16.2.3]